MKLIIIIACLYLLIKCITIEIDIDGTIWIEKDTDRPIYIISYTKQDGVIYKYAGEDFERHMSFNDLLTKYKHAKE